MSVNRHGYSVLSQGGPYTRLRTNMALKASQGIEVAQLVARGNSFSQAAAALGLSKTTAWRRYWWWQDWTLPDYYGKPRGPIPPQRGTRAVPRGRPYLPTIDSWRHGP
jgi:hypothetical protein